MFDKIKKFWKKYKFEIVVITSLLFLFVYWLIRRNKKGTWSSSYSYEKKKRKFPKESRGEMQCRSILQRIFNKPFPNVRPSFLKNSNTGKNLEIDCYNADLRLGIEYDGIGHYKYVKGMHKTYQDFLKQRDRDVMKDRLCQQNGITLIRVPYTVKLQDIEGYLKKELRNKGFHWYF